MKKIILLFLIISFLSACEDKEEQAKIQSQKKLDEIFVSTKGRSTDGPAELDLNNLIKSTRQPKEQLAGVKE